MLTGLGYVIFVWLAFIGHSVDEYNKGSVLGVLIAAFFFLAMFSSYWRNLRSDVEKSVAFYFVTAAVLLPFILSLGMAVALFFRTR
jgi:hypothetical protein